MDNWIHYATYETSNSDVHALPQSFSELFITNSTETDGALVQKNVHFLIPKAIIPNVSSANQALTLLDCQLGKFNVLRIWSGGMMLLQINSYEYDVYYR